MTLRDSNIGQFYYKLISKIWHMLPGQKFQKEFNEWVYWKYRKLTERDLKNGHYQFFFTEYFDLTEKDYSGAKVLDIGCGPRGSLEWADMTEERIGLDTLADRYVKMEGKKHKMKYVNAGSEKIPFPDGYFDIVSSFNSLDHVDDLTASINEIKRVVKPGGSFILISDIHSFPTVCEPSAFQWDIVKEFEPEFEAQQEKHFEGNNMYMSIREAVPFNHEDSRDRYGILTVKFVKKK